jgi:peptidoglycan/LPS O-acetylase OafA/YrhL
VHEANNDALGHPGQEDTAVLGEDAAGSPAGRRSLMPERTFRPDVEGLRAIAVILVVLYHAQIPGVPSGFVGVDVFFVISGFLITGLLLRERVATNSTSITRFYARRARRILPASSLVVLVTLVATYHWLGFIVGNRVAVDAKWTAVFMANIHFAAVGATYFGFGLPPSPLLHMWSLGVEEQFYLLWPTLFIVVALFFKKTSLRLRLGIVLATIIAASLAWSVVQTAQNPVWAYYSPLTRAWELALGGLIAVAGPLLGRLSARVAAAMSVVGLLGVICAAFAFTQYTPYPGSAAALPCFSTAALISAGCAIVGGPAEKLLKLAPLQWVGARSYSLYLWHWPILIIAEERVGHTLPVWENLLLVVLALAVSAVTYRLLENPVRRAKVLQHRTMVSILGGAALIVVAFGFAQIQLQAHGGGAAPTSATSTNTGSHGVTTIAEVIKEVAEAQKITSLPGDITPALTDSTDRAWPGAPDGPCHKLAGGAALGRRGSCLFGDSRSHKLMIVYGDSHAGMWESALQAIAVRDHWSLRVFALPSCPPEELTFVDFGRVNTMCAAFHLAAMAAIRALHPKLLVLTGQTLGEQSAPGVFYTTSQWKAGLVRTIDALKENGTSIVVLGNIPQWTEDDADCLAAHETSVQECMVPRKQGVPANAAGEVEAARATGVGYINPTPWVCARICVPVAGDIRIFYDKYHFTKTYTMHLSGALQQALGLGN